MNTPTIEFKTVSKDLPVFSTNISTFKDALSLAANAIFEEKQRNPDQAHSCLVN